MALSFPSIVLGFGAGLVVAFGVTLLVARDPPARGSRDVVEDEPDEAAEVPEDDIDNAPSGGVAASGVPAGTTAQLRAEVARLTKELTAERKLRETVEGKPTPFPSEVAERHTEKGLMTSVRAALAEMKLGGDVSAIDCTENPCLASAHVQGNVDIDRLLKTPALAAYAKDQPAYSASGFPDGENVLVLGFSEATQFTVEPNDADRDREEKLDQFRATLASERERRSSRVRAMFQAGMDEMAPRAAPP